MKEPTHVTAFVESGNTCLVSSSHKWVMDFGATDHMSGNLNIFSTFLSHTASSYVIITDGTTYNIVGSRVKQPTSSITLSSVLDLSNLAFNLVYVSKLMKDLNCCISFYPDHCLFQDLMMNLTIGKGHVSGGLYTLDPWIACSIACSVVSPFTIHCQFCYPALTTMKKLYPQFQYLLLCQT